MSKSTTPSKNVVPEAALLLAAESSRSQAFNLSLGIHQLRMLADNDYTKAHLWDSTRRCTLRSLIKKGVIYYDHMVPPELTVMGALARQYAILTRHIPIDGDVRARTTEEVILGLMDDMGVTMKSLQSARRAASS